MDIQSMKILMELQALQTISGTNSNSTSSSVFSSMIDDLLQSELTDATTNVASSLSSYSSISSTDLLASSPKKYLDAFLYEGQASTSIDQYLKDYTGQSGYENVLAGASSYSDTIAQAANTYNVPEKLIAAIMKQESNFNPNAVSPAGATGLMQLMPSTAKFLGVTDPTNPEQNIMGGAKYLRQMLNQFDNDIEKALAAYNAGPGNVKKYDGIPPFNETTNYVKKVLNYYRT